MHTSENFFINNSAKAERVVVNNSQNPIKPTPVKVFKGEISPEKDGKEHTFHPNGKIKEIVQYDEQGRPLVVKTYDKNGALESIKNHEYYNKREKYGEYNVKTGKKITALFNKDGIAVEKTEKDNNTDDSKYQKFNDKGVIISDDIWKNGKNTYTEYDDEGNPAFRKTIYKNEYSEESYYSDGSLKYSKSAKGDSTTSRNFNENGTFRSETIKDKDMIVSEKLMNDNGKLVTTKNTIFNDKGYEKTYYNPENGAPIATEVSKDGNITKFRHSKPDEMILTYQKKITENGSVTTKFDNDGFPIKKVIINGEDKKIIEYDENNKAITTYSSANDKDGKTVIKRDIKGSILYKSTEKDGVTLLIKKDNTDRDSYKSYVYSRTTETQNGVKHEKLIPQTNKNGKTVFKPVLTYEKTNTQDGYETNTFSPSGHLQSNTVMKNGTKTQTFYNRDGQETARHEQSPSGAKITLIKDGKETVISDIKRKDINENHYQTSRNGIAYDVKFQDEKIIIKNESDKKTSEIDLNKFLSEIPEEDKEGYVKTLKGLTGENLEDLAIEITKIYKNNPDADYLGSFDTTNEKLETTQSSLTLAHELGHAVDYIMPTIIQSSEKNEKFEDAFRRGSNRFEDSNWKTTRENIPASEKPGSIYPTTSRGEMFADIYALITRGSNDSSECVLRFFPECVEEGAKQLEEIRTLNPHERH